MKYQEFIEALPKLYSDWVQAFISSQPNRWQQLTDRVNDREEVHLYPLLHLATQYLELGEVYCELGCDRGATSIAALSDYPDVKGYVVDSFLARGEVATEQLLETLEQAGLATRVLFCQQDILEFLLELHQIDSGEYVGICLLNWNSDYRATLVALLLLKPRLAHRALLIVNHGGDQKVHLAAQDFLAVSPESKLLVEFPTASIIGWHRSQALTEKILLEKQSDRDPAIRMDSNCSWLKEALKPLYVFAIELHQRGQLDEAEVRYRQILNILGDDFEAWLNYGTLCYMKDRFNEALHAIFKAIEMDGSQAIAYYNLGLVLEAVKRNDEAILAYHKAIALDDKHLDAYNNLGNLFRKVGCFNSADEFYHKAIDADPTFPGSYINLTTLLLSVGAIEEALEVCRIALQYLPHDASVREGLEAVEYARKHPVSTYFEAGNTFYNQHKSEEALLRYKLGLEIWRIESLVYLSLAVFLISYNQYRILADWWHERYKMHMDFTPLCKFFIQSLCSENYIEDTIKTAEAAEECLSDVPIFKLFARLSLPVFYKSEQEIQLYRQRFKQGLQRLIHEVEGANLCDCKILDGYDQAIASFTNFYLPYQGKCDVKLQQQYGNFVHRIMAAKYSHLLCSVESPSRTSEGKIRIGFVSPHMKALGLGELYAGWLRYSDRKLLEIYCYYLGEVEDSLTQEFRKYSHVFHKIDGSIEAVARQVLADKLHIVILPEIGLEPKTVQLAALRLAPIQCTTWAHPITSGLPTVDYFLSSQLMEPANGQEHYSEKLVPLANLGFSYPKPKLPEATKQRDFFGLREDSVVYLACQSLKKYLPQHDRIYAEILRRVPQAQIAFIAYPSDRITEQFRSRLDRKLKQFGLDMQERCVITPRLVEQDYLNLNMLSDIFLDSFLWSGGITTLKAVACSLPVVTCPGELMRGRHSYAILQMLRITETIASTEAEYLEIAVRLGLDPEWRIQIVERIRKRHSYLYDDRECVRDLEAFCRSVVSK